eukprot:Gb_13650 [translate_table: standard]
MISEFPSQVLPLQRHVAVTTLGDPKHEPILPMAR